ncbi:MAG: pseudouridine synthase, partial [Bacillota bacterium]
KGEKDTLSMLPSDLKRLRLFPIGRLDKSSSGLILLTNDGRITDRLLNPDREHEKTYDVTTKLPLRPSFAEHMEQGVNIEGYMTRPTTVEVLSENKFRITLTEGKKHQIRRMVVAMHNEVRDLRRISIMNIKLGKLPIGEYRRLEGKELATFLASLGL